MFLVKLASICQQCSGNASGRIVGEIPLNKSESNQALICGLFSLLQSTPSCLRRWVKIRRIHSFADSEKCIGFSFWSSLIRTESTLGTGRKHGLLTKCELCREKEDCRNIEIAPKVLLLGSAT